MSTASKLKLEDLPAKTTITETQALCIRHLLKEFAQILESTDSIIEHRADDLTPDELHSCLEGLSRRLDQCLGYLEKDTFCCIEPARCAFVSKFTGCKPLKDRDGI